MVLRNRNDVQRYYTHTIGNCFPNNEGLYAPITDDFANLISSIEMPSAQLALDLGYGFGNYSIALAKSGFRVDAVDYIPATFLEERLLLLSGEDKEWIRRIRIFETELSAFVPSRSYRVVVAKDVLHFLGQADVEKLLTSVVSTSTSPSCHYLEVFTDILRTSRNGSTVKIEGEANYSTRYLRETVERLYTGWDVEWSWTEHSERAKNDGEDRYYFRANRATIIARKR